MGALSGLGGALVAIGITASVRLRTEHVSVPFVAGIVPPIPFDLYGILGCLAVGGAVAYLHERYRTVWPAIVITLVYLSAIGWTGWRIHTWEGPSGVQEHIPVLPWVTVYEHVVLGWPVILVCAVLVAMIERAFGA